MSDLTNDWRSDNGRPAYALPLIVDVPISLEEPDGKRDISYWAKHQEKFDYWLALRSGASEWNARVFLQREILVTLEHGKTYTRQEVSANPIWQGTKLKLPEKFQFIVEDLRREYPDV